MRQITYVLLWLFVFSVPWEETVTLFGLGSLSKLFGMAAVGSGLVTIVATGRLRRPGGVLWCTFAFVALAMASVIWASAPDSMGRAITYVQLALLVLVLWEVANRPERVQGLMNAYWLGAFVSVVDLVRSFLSGEQFETARFSGGNLNPNDLGLTLALGIPFAWYTFLHRTGWRRLLAASYIPASMFSILLTGSRGSLVPSLVALAIVPLTVSFRSARKLALGSTALIITAALAIFAVPEDTWKRLSTLQQEATEGNISGRLDIWRAGLQVFQERPFFGVGAGAFEWSVQSLVPPPHHSHNLFVGVVVEQGVVGLLIFLCLLIACGFGIARLSGIERKIWATVAITWSIGVMSAGWHYRKTTWLLIGLVAAQTAITAAQMRGYSRPATLHRRPLKRPGAIPRPSFPAAS